MLQSNIRIRKRSEVSHSLIRPVAVRALEGTNIIIVIDHNEKCVCKMFDFSTKACSYSFGTYGSGTGEFKYPVSVCIIGSVLCIADYHRNVIIILTYEGYLVSEVDLNCFSRESKFSDNPWSLSYSALSSNLYGASLLSNRIFTLSSQLPFQITFGKGVLVNPLCVCVGENEIIFVLDRTTNIKYFQEDGTFIGNIILIKIFDWCSESLVRFVIDKKGNFILCPSSLNSLVVFSPTGDQVFPASRAQTEELAFDNPMDVSLDQKGRILLVSDTFNEEVQLFDYSN